MKLPIGVSDFKKLIEGGYYFVDKSLFIKDVANDNAEVMLISRPRRFGKTLNMSMLQYYFNNESNQNNLFNDLLINKDKGFREQHYHKYPVIFITLKDVKSNGYDETLAMLAFIMAETYREHKTDDLLNILDADEEQTVARIIEKKATDTELKTSLTKLTEYLYRIYKKKVIVLIDEYDTPVHSAYNNKYYDNFIDFYKTFLGTALKGNRYLDKAVITGITRVAQASIFSDLNNFKVYSVLDKKYGEYFGFTEEQVKDLLTLSKSQEHSADIKLWYNGYHIQDHVLYNPWSILNCLSDGISDSVSLKPHWVNTSDNSLIKNLISKSKYSIKEVIGKLLQGETVEQPIAESLVFKDLDRNEEAIWSLLLYSGYLTVRKSERKDWLLMADLYIPNKEIMFVYDQIISSWFSDVSSLSSYKLFIKSLITGDLGTFESMLSDYICSAGSYFDFNTNTKEQVFHSLILGLVLGLRDNYVIKSNNESGYGRYDVMLMPRDKDNKGIIIELKVTTKESDLTRAAKEALNQIEDRKYITTFKEEKVNNVLFIGIAFCGKKLKLMSKES